MPHPNRCSLSCLAVAAAALVLCSLPAPDAAASGYGRFQHGGRGTAEVGAMVARADSPLAVRYNPAGLTEVPGLQLEGGLDFSNATDEYADASGGYEADHSIQFPPFAYLSWNDPERLGNWTLGIGIDTSQWYRVDWDPVFFPLRGDTRLNDLKIWELHPVAAYRLSDRWSVGGGLRYEYGSTEWGRNGQFSIAADPDGPFYPVEYKADADTHFDGYGFDLGVQYRSRLWGFGAVYRSKVELEGSGNRDFVLRDPPADPSLTPSAQGVLDTLPRGFSTRFDLPRELDAGIWFAPYPELRFEVDLAWVNWSNSRQDFAVGVLGFTPSDRRRMPVDLQGGWNDTLSVRAAVEGDVNDFLTLTGGIAWEPSPESTSRISPAWPRAEAIVYAAGTSFHYEKVTFDLGYSFHDHADATIHTTDPPGTFSSHENVWSASARYHF